MRFLFPPQAAQRVAPLVRRLVHRLVYRPLKPQPVRGRSQRRWQRPIALFLAAWWVVLTWAAIGSDRAVAQVSPQDLGNYWAKACISSITERQWISLDPAGNFRPNAPMNQQDWFDALSRAIPLGQPITITGDPAAPLARSAALALAAQRLGLANLGDAGGAVMTVQTFEDGREVNPSDRAGIAALVAAGKLVNYPNPKRLQPDQPVTRGEAASFLCQVLENELETPATQNFPDFIPRSPELRGVWLTNVDSDVMFDRARFRMALETLKTMGFNTIYLTVWNDGYTLFPSPVGQRVTGRAVHPEPGLQRRDVLAEAVAECRRLGLKIVPWLEFGMMAPQESDLAQRHPDWLTKRRDGTTDYTYGEHVRVWLNPTHPEVQQLMLDLVRDILSRYNVDGIQLDDHFGMPIEAGYDALNVAKYKAERQNQEPPADPRDPDWMAWRSQRVSDLMAKVRQTIRDTKPNVYFSLSPNPQPFAYQTYLQNWPAWVAQGWIDELIVQIYRSGTESLERELQERNLQLASNRIPVSIGLLTGLKPQPMPIGTVADQVRVVRRNRLMGVAFFFYESLWNLASEAPTRRQQVIRRLLTPEINPPKPGVL